MAMSPATPAMPERDRELVQKEVRAAWAPSDHAEAIARLRALADELARSHPGAAASLREGLEENVTVPRLGIKGALKRTLATNPCEPMIECVRRSSRNVKHWQSGDMASPPNRSPDRHREVPRRPGHPLETSTASLRMGYA